MNFAIAPCSWGVEHAENPDYPHWSIVLDQVVAAGYSGIELGPYGFLPTDSQMLSEELTNRSIQVIAGTLYKDLTKPAALKELLEKTKSICSLLSQISKTEAKKFLVLIDNVKPARNTLLEMQKRQYDCLLEHGSSLCITLKLFQKLLNNMV